MPRAILKHKTAVLPLDVTVRADEVQGTVYD